MKLTRINGKWEITSDFSGEDYTSAKIKIEQTLLDSKVGIPTEINKIFDVITMGYIKSNF